MRVARFAASLAASAVVAGTLLTAGAATATATPAATNGPCHYTATPDDPSPRHVPLPQDPHHTPSQGTVSVDMPTTQGSIPLTLDRAKAPCTVQSFLWLAQHHFYDLTTCHRLTSYPTLQVLQCGDPKGNGEGGPGYSYKDELPVGLPQWPGRPDRVVYARGFLAMANAGPDTNGSQFFLVIGDSRLAPAYNVFGTVGAEGLATLDRVYAGGIAPTADDPAPVDGTPNLTTTLLSVREQHGH